MTVTAKSVHLDISDIKIPASFEKKLPSTQKIADRINCYRKTGTFDREIVVDGDNNLLDGYTVYLTCKMLDIKSIRCIRVKHKGMTPNEYQKAALRTAGNNDLDVLLLNGVMGLNGEAGECIDMVKKCMFQGHGLDYEHLAKELGDVAWYLAVTAYSIGYDLEDIMKMNVDKLKARYPDGFDAGRSNNRAKEDF